MVKGVVGKHHLHKRKRVHVKLEKYPHPNKLKRIVDKLIYFVGIIGPIMALPQLYNIWILNVASGVSVLTWGAFFFMEAFWVLYGVLHKEKPIIVTYSIWLVFDFLVVLGTLIYG